MIINTVAHYFSVYWPIDKWAKCMDKQIKCVINSSNRYRAQLDFELSANSSLLTTRKKYFSKHLVMYKVVTRAHIQTHTHTNTAHPFRVHGTLSITCNPITIISNCHTNHLCPMRWHADLNQCHLLNPYNMIRITRRLTNEERLAEHAADS